MMAQVLGDGNRHHFWVADGRQGDKTDAILEMFDHFIGCLNAQPGFANSGGAGQGQQVGVGEKQGFTYCDDIRARARG